MKKRIISPSLLSANFTRLKEDIKVVEDAGVSRLHLDVMDGHFVPNLTFGPFIIKDIRKITKSHLETHLMINNPHKYFDEYIKAGSDTLIFHYEPSNVLLLNSFIWPYLIPNKAASGSDMEVINIEIIATFFEKKNVISKNPNIMSVALQNERYSLSLITKSILIFLLIKLTIL